MNKQLKRTSRKTLTQYSKTINEHGVMVRAECLRIQSGRQARLEILLDGAGQKAVVDVPVGDLSLLEELVGRHATAFAAAVSLRLDDDGRLR